MYPKNNILMCLGSIIQKDGEAEDMWIAIETDMLKSHWGYHLLKQEIRYATVVSI